VRPKK
jgi:hypothetical protein